MIKFSFKGGDIAIECGGNVAQLAAEFCEGISSLYARLPDQSRGLFKQCVLLAVTHKDSPMWAPRRSNPSVETRSEDGELQRQLQELLRKDKSGEGGGRRAEG